MLVYEFKAYGKPTQYKAIDEAIRTGQFIRNKCLRYWMDHKGTNKATLSGLCKSWAAEFPFANKLNSMARQAHAERAWCSISRFYDNCKKGVQGQKGYPNFKKDSRSVSIHDASWYQFRVKLEYFGKVFGTKMIPVAPHGTSQECSACGEIVKKTLSTRTHICTCGCVLDRDENAAINILHKALGVVGHTIPMGSLEDPSKASGDENRCQAVSELSDKFNL